MSSAQFVMYKEFRRPLQDAAADWFQRHGSKTPSRTPYILSDRKDWNQNIIDPVVFEEVKKVRPLHTFIHHGLSSQSLCFNLLGPLMVRKDLAPLEAACRAAGVPWDAGVSESTFEHDDEDVFHEKGGEQPTSWDFAVGKAGSRRMSVLVEVKFVETSLGTCSVFERGDCDGVRPANPGTGCYLAAAKGRTYWSVFERLGLMRTAPFAGFLCPLTACYQFYREVAFAADTDASMVYLIDDRNPVLWRGTSGSGQGIIRALLDQLPPELARRVFVIPIPVLLDAIQATGRHDDWLGEFRSKYCM